MRSSFGQNIEAWLRRAKFAYEMAAPRRYLLVMSHMRSYSSLLSHLLDAHPEIDGYVELHKPYRTELDLVELALRVRHGIAEPLRGRYVVDKVLHNYDVKAEVLQRPDVYTVFTIREPQQSIRSIVALGRRREQLDWKSDVTKVVNHYVKRLDALVDVMAAQPRNSLYFEADNLIHNTDGTLRTIATFLQLKTPLRPSYEASPLTGQAGYGDPGEYIGSGQIVASRDDYSYIEVPEELMARAREAYERADVALARGAQIVVPSVSSGERSRSGAQA